jgi:hypothetical protein
MWRLFESEGGILSINPYLKTALEKLQSVCFWGNDASPIFEGDQLFMDIQINKDDIYESLFADYHDLMSLAIHLSYYLSIESPIHSIMLLLQVSYGSIDLNCQSHPTSSLHFRRLFIIFVCLHRIVNSCFQSDIP